MQCLRDIYIYNGERRSVGDGMFNQRKVQTFPSKNLDN